MLISLIECRRSERSIKWWYNDKNGLPIFPLCYWNINTGVHRVRLEYIFESRQSTFSINSHKLNPPWIMNGGEKRETIHGKCSGGWRSVHNYLNYNIYYIHIYTCFYPKKRRVKKNTTFGIKNIDSYDLIITAAQMLVSKYITNSYEHAGTQCALHWKRKTTPNNLWLSNSMKKKETKESSKLGYHPKNITDFTFQNANHRRRRRHRRHRHSRLSRRHPLPPPMQ